MKEESSLTVLINLVYTTFLIEQLMTTNGKDLPTLMVCRNSHEKWKTNKVVATDEYSLIQQSVCSHKFSSQCFDGNMIFGITMSQLYREHLEILSDHLVSGLVSEITIKFHFLLEHSQSQMSIHLLPLC